MPKYQTIKELLAGENARITLGDRWLVSDADRFVYTVYERRPFAKKTRIIAQDVTEAEAVAALAAPYADEDE